MSSENNNDGLWLLFFIMFFICAFLYGIWFLFKPYILDGFLLVRQWEIMLAALWTEDSYRVPITVNGEASSMSFGEARELVRTLTPEVLLREDMNTWEILNAISLAVLMPLRYLFGAIMGFFFLYILFRGPTTYYRRMFNLDGLIKVQAETFRVVTPFIDFNPLKEIAPRAPGQDVPAELPLFSEALSPEEWIAFHRLTPVDGQFDPQRVEAAFSQQLGESWKGAKALPPYMQVLLAAFALKAARKRSESDEFLGDIAECWTAKDGLNLTSAVISKARRILKDKKIAEGTIKACNRHAYVTTALIGALDYARTEGGVLAPAQFLWLRGHDRALWYPLNNLGRSAFHMEAMGAMSHYRTEFQVKRPIPKPMMADAINALTAYVNNPKKMQPIPQVDYSMVKGKDKNKNKGVMKPAGT